jgi:polyhydroxybutyrate depolymerase
MKPSHLIAGPLAASALLLSAVCASARPAGPDDRRDARVVCASLKPGDHDRTITVAGKVREYRLHVPRAGACAPRPLVIVLHGGAGSGPNVQGFSLMDPVSDANGFIAAYPSGPRGLIGGTWNAADCCGLAMEKGSKDLEFMSAVIDGLVSMGCVDPKRVYATGISNGGMFAYHLACDLSDKIAAIAPISGALMDPTCVPRRPVSVLIYHGTGDKFVPWKGGGDFHGPARATRSPRSRTT